MNAPRITRSLGYVAVVCGFAIVLNVTGLRLPGWLTLTVIAWGIVGVMFICGIVSSSVMGQFTRMKAAMAFGIAGALALVGIAIRIGTTDASSADLAFMLIDNDEYLGAKLQALGYALIAYLLGVSVRQLLDLRRSVSH